MVFGLIGLLFNVVTFPGVVVNTVAQNYYVGKHSVPTETIRLNGDVEQVDDLAKLDEEEFEDALDVARDERETEEVIDYTAIESFSGAFAIVVMPFVVSTVLAFLVFLTGLALFDIGTPAFYIAFWLGLSFGAHAFPNDGATAALWKRSKSSGSLLRVVSVPVVGVAKLANLLSFFWLDAIYAVVLYAVAKYGVYQPFLSA